MKNGPYELIVAPEDYPGKKYRGRYAYEHRVVYWLTYGKLPSDKVVHHKNHNKRDNRPKNLKLQTVADHIRHHYTRPWTCVFINCAWCGGTKRISGAHYRSKVKVSGNKFYCNRECQHMGLIKDYVIKKCGTCKAPVHLPGGEVRNRIRINKSKKIFCSKACGSRYTQGLVSGTRVGSRDKAVNLVAKARRRFESSPLRVSK